MLKLVHYKCAHCGSEETDLFEDEPVPECCSEKMQRTAFPNSLPVHATYKCFRPYTVDKVRVTSKEQEMAIKKRACSAGEKPEDIRLVKESAAQRKVQIEQLRHEAIQKFEARSPQIAERIKNRPMPEFVD